MKTTFLFDLDGTLLPMDFDKFMALYFGNLGQYFKDKLDPRLLAKYIMASTEEMVKANNNDTNETVFMNHFETLIDGDIEEYKQMFLDFYNSEFENVKASTYESIEMRKSIDLLKEKGYEVAIATNPLFPLIANYHRLRWAGFKPEEFLHITSFENNSYCKPHLEYYKEVLSEIKRNPQECYMVGNDIYDDLSVGKLGVETYLITDCLLNKHNQENTADHTGTYKDFYQFVVELPSIK